MPSLTTLLREGHALLQETGDTPQPDDVGLTGDERTTHNAFLRSFERHATTLATLVAAYNREVAAGEDGDVEEAHRKLEKVVDEYNSDLGLAVEFAAAVVDRAENELERLSGKALRRATAWKEKLEDWERESLDLDLDAEKPVKVRLKLSAQRDFAKLPVDA